ncbi:unnamed protein product [Brassicogethes aeneus]|uniref:Shootin-1 n=1 Tax=Brassicogethes aeneus TaxID=1431903 RepID=A0A9P0FGF8_BRAAE|nr:unnamed protein product [Brassicogethes aeneus]
MSTITANKLTPNSKTNGFSNIPKRYVIRQNSTPSKIPVNNPEAHKWKNRYEDCEIKRKNILSEKEKILRSYNDINKKYTDLQVKHECLETELFEKNEEHTKLTIASKNLYKEYETLKNLYETETGAMARALKVSSQWYKENKELKRRTIILDEDTVDEGVDSGEAASDSDIENLNRTIKQLSSEVAELQTEVDSLKESEFQTIEQNSKLSEDLECERQKYRKLNQDFEELKKEYDQILRVSEMVKKELQEMKQNEEDQRNNVVSLKREADNYKKERNVLAHQSTLILQGLNEGTNNEMVLLQEIEDLKRSLEDERNKHEEELNSLQEKLEEKDHSQVEILEERLNIVESELEEAVKRAEKAEETIMILKTPPAPPPPPPPPALPSQPPVVPLRVKRRSRVNVLDIAETIGVQDQNNDTKKTQAAPGVNDDIINAIKEGKFTLKKAKSEGKKEKESTKAVSELLNILGSLRRAPKKRQSQFIGDVQL